MSSNRDEFSSMVKRVLADRAVTSGPQVDPAKSVSVGVAAHITAASPGGPRYDASLSTEERSAAANGIWLCQNCAKLVDNDQSAFSVDLLKTWKRSAEAETLAMVGRTVQSLAPSPQRLTEAEAEILIACAQSGDIARMHVDQLGFWVRAGGATSWMSLILRSRPSTWMLWSGCSPGGCAATKSAYVMD